MNRRQRHIGPAGINKRGYWTIKIRGKQHYLHRLIFEQAHGPIPRGHHIHHIDEDKANCSLQNLRCLPAGKHISLHFIGLRPSHHVLPDATIAKRCMICGDDIPLKELYPIKTRAGTYAYRPYCRSCYQRAYGWEKRELEA